MKYRMRALYLADEHGRLEKEKGKLIYYSIVETPVRYEIVAKRQRFT